MSGRGGIPRENTPRWARRWNKEDLRHPVALIVRCRGRRILAAGMGDPAPLTFTYRGIWSAFILAGVRFRADRSTGNASGRVGVTRVIDCPNHYEGHVIDGTKLREVLDRRGRHAAPAPVDVRDVELD